MKRMANFARFVVATALISFPASAQTLASGGQIIPLYANGTVQSPGLPEARMTLETGDTMTSTSANRLWSCSVRPPVTRTALR